MLQFKLSLAISRQNCQPILDCFIPNFKLKYEDSENIKADRVNTVVFNLHPIKRRALFLGHSVDGLQICSLKPSELGSISFTFCVILCQGK